LFRAIALAPGSALKLRRMQERHLLRAELSDAQRRVPVGRRTFTVSVPVASYGAGGDLACTRTKASVENAAIW
jgi:hypothetical protein